MATRRFTIPFRGKVKLIKSNGDVEADGQIEPIDLGQLGMESAAVREAPDNIEAIMENYDYEAGTVDVIMTCPDSGYLDDLEALVAATSNLLTAETSMNTAKESGLSGDERSKATAERIEFAKGVQISSANLATWKQANGR